MDENGENQFKIVSSSDLDYEKMVVILYSGVDEVAVLNCDKQDDRFEIKILDRNENRVIWTFDLPSLISALSSGLEKLKEINRPLDS